MPIDFVADSSAQALLQASLNRDNLSHRSKVIGFKKRGDTVCPRSLDPFYMVTYYKKWVELLGQTVYTEIKRKKFKERLTDRKKQVKFSN